MEYKDTATKKEVIECAKQYIDRFRGLGLQCYEAHLETFIKWPERFKFDEWIILYMGLCMNYNLAEKIEMQVKTSHSEGKK